MRTLDQSSNYKKDLKKISSQKAFKKEKYNKAITQLLNKEPLDRIYDDHPVAKHSPAPLQGCRIMHISPNICVVYKILEDDSIYLMRIGSHQDLNLTERLRVKLRKDNPSDWI